MGVLKLMDFIKKKFPKSIVKRSIPDFSNKVLTIDASNWMYQFLIKTQTLKSGSINTPTDPLGNQTGHLIGMLSRVALCLQNNIQTIWVFDGKPPQQKYQQLKRRRSLKQQAQQKIQVAKEEGEDFNLLKMAQRTIKITQIQKNNAKKLIELIGLPVIQSPSQAEPQCAEIVKSGLAYGCVSEDMDTLAFGCPRLLRYFNKPQQLVEVSLQLFLKESNLTYDQFIDLCILCGCDYTTRIKNIGPVKAYDYILKYGTIDNILSTIASDQKMSKKHTFTDDFNHFSARKIFKSPEVRKITGQQIKLRQMKEKELFDFLISLQFNETRIKNWLQRVHKTNLFTQ